MFLNQTLEVTKNSFIIRRANQVLTIQEWGSNTVRITHSLNKDDEAVAEKRIEELDKNKSSEYSLWQEKEQLVLLNQDLKVVYDGERLVFYYKEQEILKEYSRKQSNVRRTIGIDEDQPIIDAPSSSLNVSPRIFEKSSLGKHQAILRFEGDSNEKIFGMGGYQEENLDKNFGTYELMHRNSQTSIPFYLSNKHYGFIWNDASVGEVSFSKNQKKWTSFATDSIDYLVTVGATPKTIIENYTEMTGRAPKMNRDLLGLWQSKLRYQTLDEVKEVERQYQQRKIQLSVLVIDYFHWTADGDFEFDFNYWKGIQSYAYSLKEKQTQLMVSLWPTVTQESKYYDEYASNKMVIQAKEGSNALFDGKEILDFSNPKTAVKMQTVLETNYRQNGIDLYWADQAEPEMDSYTHHQYTVHEGDFASVANRYPYHYLKAVQPQVTKNEACQPVLIRSAWFNSQKYGALAWSGDIESSFESLRKQIQIGLNMGISGIPWWTSDIAGFHSGDSESAQFKELMIRWFQFAVFSPILRMHGDRQPHTPRIGEAGGGIRTSGGPNEIWSFGTEVEEILTKFIAIREKLKPYIESVYQESTDYGYPLMRSLFLEFPEDENAWNETTNYMFGQSLLVIPVVEKGQKEREIYLPAGETWIDVYTGERLLGGKTYRIPLTIDQLPVYCKSGTTLEKEIIRIFHTK